MLVNRLILNALYHSFFYFATNAIKNLELKLKIFLGGCILDLFFFFSKPVENLRNDRSDQEIITHEAEVLNNVLIHHFYTFFGWSKQITNQ